MPEDVIIKIGIVGNFTEDNVKLISKRSGSALSLNAFIMKKKPILFEVQYIFLLQGKSKVSEDQHIWKALPLVCFLNDNSQQSLSKVYSRKMFT